jgi:hypothetical protein
VPRTLSIRRVSDGIPVRLSARESFIWQLHLILDRLPRRGLRTAFAREVLLTLGVPAEDAGKMAETVAQTLPEQLARTDMSHVLGALERSVPIQWVNDLVEVGDGVAESLQQALIEIFAGVSRPAFPREVTGQILEAAARVVGPNSIPNDLAPSLREAIENTLVHDLWRSRDAAAYAALADRVIRHFREKARLDVRPNNRA